MAKLDSATLTRLAAEFVVIVTGVLVALFAESAWQERAERIEERETLERIADDLVVDSLLLWFDQELGETLEPALATVPEILAGSSTLSPEAQLATLFYSALIHFPPPQGETWGELVTSGRTDLISDVEVRRGIARYYARRDLVEEIRSQLPRAYRTDVVSLLPTTYANRVLRECAWEPEMAALSRPFPHPDGFEAIRTCGVVPEGGAQPYLDRIRALPDLARRAGTLGYEMSALTNRVKLNIEDLANLRRLLPDADVERSLDLIT